MRLRNTMLHSGNLKAVLTTNLQPPIPPPCMPPSTPFGSLPPSPLSFRATHLRLPILTPSAHTYYPSIAVRAATLSSSPYPHRYFLILSPLPAALASRLDFPSFAAASVSLPLVSDDLQVHVDKSANLT